MLGLFDHVYATYQPPESERDARYAGAVDLRTVFQIVGHVTLEEGTRAGELVLMPRDLRDGTAHLLPPRVPLSHVVDVEPAPAEAAGKFGGQALGMGGG